MLVFVCEYICWFVSFQQRRHISILRREPGEKPIEIKILKTKVRKHITAQVPKREEGKKFKIIGTRRKNESWVTSSD